MREFIRHPLDIPLRFRILENQPAPEEQLNNLGQGGLSFRSANQVDAGTQVQIDIEITRPPFLAVGTVVWCKPAGQDYDVGVQFIDANQEYSMRMAEQVCHIVHYWRDALKQGRKITVEDAASEWINTDAPDFPQIYKNKF